LSFSFIEAGDSRVQQFQSCRPNCCGSINSLGKIVPNKYRKEQIQISAKLFYTTCDAKKHVRRQGNFYLISSNTVFNRE